MHSHKETKKVENMPLATLQKKISLMFSEMIGGLGESQAERVRQLQALVDVSLKLNEQYENEIGTLTLNSSSDDHDDITPR